ncbi:MAG: 50S ribosomal protein L4 [Candidatus Cloacimonadota bacterium]|nr:MAG: 50S ribosomal protein L4 [Candidatus Cloacimonadota bacterium]
MEVKKYNNLGEEIGTVNLNENIFGFKVNRDVLYEVINMYLANQRWGTSFTRTRAEVRGSGRKLYRQKGTGRARMGSNRSPIRVGGGRAFGPKPKNWHKKIPKKKKRIALKSALSDKAQNISIIEEFAYEKPSIKQSVNILNNMNVKPHRCLILIPDNNKMIIKSFRNIPNLELARAADLNPYQVLKAQHIIITEQALKIIEEVFGNA